MLRDIRIASPCLAKWERMTGNDQVRHCPECDRDVYNLSAMTECEAEQFIAMHAGRLCARVYQRTDGTVLTQDCPLGRQVVSRRVSRIAGAALSAAMGLGFGAAQTVPDGNWQPMVQIDRSEGGATIRVSDYTGAGVQSATVMLEDSINNIRLFGTTDGHGLLRFPFVAPGRYQLTINAVGFRTYHESRVIEEQREVEVVGEQPAIETAHVELPGLIEQREFIVTMGMVAGVSHGEPSQKKAPKHSAHPKAASSSSDGRPR